MSADSCKEMAKVIVKNRWNVMIPIGETEEIEDEKTLNIHEATKRKY